MPWPCPSHALLMPIYFLSIYIHYIIFYLPYPRCNHRILMAFYPFPMPCPRVAQALPPPRPCPAHAPLMPCSCPAHALPMPCLCPAHGLPMHCPCRNFFLNKYIHYNFRFFLDIRYMIFSYDFLFF